MQCPECGHHWEPEPTTITVNMPPVFDGDDVVRALKKYQRRHGAMPIDKPPPEDG